MWHVDEGALHAYLDGALDEYPAAEARRVREHLDACAECTKRLDEERRVRAEAQEILGLAAPRVDVPSFEELRAYVRAQAPRRSAASARLYRLGWAASVVLALGTGWLLRGGSTPAVLGTGASSSAPVGAAAPSADRAAESALEAEEQVRTNELRADGATEPRAAEPVAGSAPARQRLAVAGGAALDEVVAARAPEATSAPAETRREVAPVADAVVGRSAGSLATVLADSADGDEVASKAADDVADVFAANARRAAPEPTAPSATSGAPAPAPEAVRQDAAAPARDGAPPAQAAAPRATDQRLTSAITVPTPVAPGVVTGAGALTRGADAEPPAPADAAEVEEGTALVVPGLEVLDVLPVGQGTTFAGMRALQRLPQGDTLELFHLPAGIDPSSLPPLRPEWNEIVRQRGAGWLVMRAPLPDPSLLELLQRLESAR